MSESFNALGHQFAKEHDIPYVDYMSELIRIIENHTHAEPLMESGALRKLNDEYFKRIEAISIQLNMMMASILQISEKRMHSSLVFQEHQRHL